MPATRSELQQLPVPGWHAPFVANWHKDVYPAISTDGALANAANGLRVLVTGGGIGIGRTIALTFAKAGAAKVVISGRNSAYLEQSKKSIQEAAKNTEVIAVTGDVTDEASVKKIFEDAGELDGEVHLQDIDR